MTCGIYKLDFIETFYIGRSIDIESRYYVHLQKMKNNIHYNENLNIAYKQYGIPKLEILEECNVQDLNNKEIEYIKKFKATIVGLNISIGGQGADPGETNPKAKYSNDEIEQVFHYLVDNPLITLVNVSKLFNVSYSVIQNISKGLSHKWLKSKYPEKYSILESYKGKRYTTCNVLNKTYPALLSPEKEIINIEHSIPTFAKKYSLDVSNLRKLLNRKVKSCKGWTLHLESNK